MTSEPYPFIKGLELSRLLFEEAVKPILSQHFPQVLYSAALFGTGSEVLGYDTPQSMDHDWGPRLLIFLTEADRNVYHDVINSTLRQALPNHIYGIPTNLAVVRSDSPLDMPPEIEGTTNHRISILNTRRFFRELLTFDPTQEISAIDWVITPSSTLLGLVSGAIFHDGLGELLLIRERLKYYPHDVWLYLLAAQWRRIDQEEPFMGRCGQVGDDLGSRLIAGRLIRDLMRLCFLIERQYAPYNKWFGTAFASLSCADTLMPIFNEVLSAASWQAREQPLSQAYGAVAQMHNALGITAPIEAKVSPFYDRPFNVIHSNRFVHAIREKITSAEVLALPAHLGSIDQFTDSTDVLHYLERFRKIYRSIS